METLNKEDKDKYEQILLERARKLWIDDFRNQKEGTDVEKVRYMVLEGRINDKLEADLCVDYYRKNGLWRDGITPLDERKKQLVLEKAEFGKKIATIKNSRAKDYESIIKRASEKKKDLEETPTKLKEEYRIERDKLIGELINALNLSFETTEKELNTEIANLFDDKIKKLVEYQSNTIKATKEQLNIVKKNKQIELEQEVNSYGAELEAELSVLANYTNDEQIISQYQDEVKKINQELNEVEINILQPKTIESTVPNLDYSDFTIAELKEIANKKNIKVPERILKKDLIELIIK